MRSILFGLIFLHFFTNWAAAQKYNYSGTYSPLNLHSSPFIISNDYLDQHDIVYKSPTVLEAEGLPLGNGNLGGMVWNHENGIEIQINKNDLWTAPMKDEDDKSILKHAARLKIDFGFPIYSWIHLKEFTGRLSLKKGELSFESEGAMSKSTIRTWLANNQNVWIIEIDNQYNDLIMPNGSTAQINLERIGSRAFAGWYGGWFPKNPAIGVGQANVSNTAKDIILNEKSDGLHFSVVCRILNNPSNKKIVNQRRGILETNASKFTILLAVVTDKESEDPTQAAIKHLDDAEYETIDKLKQKKDQWYHNFWSNSFVKIGNNYIENIYYLRRYLMAAGSQGLYPITFNGGLWRWNRDVMNWVTPHHWNTQQQYWGILSQNDATLMKPYLDTYFKMTPYGEASAKRKGATRDAILFSEAHDFDGKQVSEDWHNMKYNYSVAPQVAALFYDYYKYTGDRTFLKDTAYVFMKKALNFYLDKIEWNNSLAIFELESSIYESESIEKVKNSESDRNALQSLLINLIEASDILKISSEETKHWQHVLSHLWQPSFESVIDCGETIAGATAYFTEEKSSPYNWAIGGAVAFPGSLIGIDQADEKIGKAVANFVKCRDFVNAHHPVSIIAARMGMGDEALQYVTNGINTHQFYPQGFMTNVTGYPENLYDLESIHDVIGTHKIRSKDFFQGGMEAVSNYATTINEMLLQSNEGKIRVFPAIPTAWQDSTIAFTLHARAGFIVSAIRTSGGNIQPLGVKSKFGNMCHVHNPWPHSDVKVYELNDQSRKNIKFTIKNDVVSFKTEKDKEYILIPASQAINKDKIELTGTANQRPKKLGKRTLGRESGWNDGFINE